MAKNADLLRDLEGEMKKFQKIEADMSEIQKQKKARNTQKNENDMVQEELQFLAEDAVLYKMIGPVLVKQTKAEVATTVAERLKFVNSEIAAADAQYKALTKTREEQRAKVISLQQAVQASGVKK
jgi:prefoldin beta subunit